MARDDRDLQDTGAERQPRREPTDRLRPGGAAGEPYNRWRERPNAPQRAKTAIPFSTQEFTLWLQYGGWRFLLGALILVGVIAALIIMTGQPNDQGLGVSPQPSLAPASDTINIRTPLPTVTQPAISPTVPAAAGGVKFVVTGTGSEGLFLRGGPTRESQVLKTLPEGTEVTIIGDDVPQAGMVWKHVKDPQGAEGYASADFLKQSAP